MFLFVMQANIASVIGVGVLVSEYEEPTRNMFYQFQSV